MFSPNDVQICRWSVLSNCSKIAHIAAVNGENFPGRAWPWTPLGLDWAMNTYNKIHIQSGQMKDVTHHLKPPQSKHCHLELHFHTTKWHPSFVEHKIIENVSSYHCLISLKLNIITTWREGLNADVREQQRSREEGNLTKIMDVNVTVWCIPSKKANGGSKN